MAPDGADLGRDRDGGIAFGDEYMLPAAAGSLRSRPLWYLRYHLPHQLCWWDNKTFTTVLRASPKRQNIMDPGIWTMNSISKRMNLA